jgi:hypothetical protein
MTGRRGQWTTSSTQQLVTRSSFSLPLSLSSWSENRETGGWIGFREECFHPFNRITEISLERTHTHTSIVGWPFFSRARRRRYPPPKSKMLVNTKRLPPFYYYWSFNFDSINTLWAPATHRSINSPESKRVCVCWMERDFPGLPHPTRAPSFDFNETNLLIELLAFVYHNRHSCLIGKMYNSFGRNQQSKVGFEFWIIFVLLVWLIFTSATPQSRSG